MLIDFGALERDEGKRMSELLHNQRQKDVLLALVQTYIETAEPVGSESLAKRYDFGVSPATIRNVLVELEKGGYLIKPHTSAGRIPSEKAYRFYVDMIQEARPITDLQMETIREALNDHGGGVDELLKRTSLILSSFSRYMGIVLSPRKLRSIFKRVSFIRIRPGTVLVVLVSVSGITQNRLVNYREDFTQDTLDKMSRYLSERFSGMSLAEMRRKVMEDIRVQWENYDRMMKAALELGSYLLDEEESGDVYVGGSSNILDIPEFIANIEWMKQLLRTVEEKGNIVALLDESMKAEGLMIHIGSEIGIDGIRGISLVTSTYGNGQSSLGTVGIIGPTRMDYSQVIPLVASAADAVSESLSKTEI
jgi:heat-inducible transcriptional repressor